jgi:hypothetical protein
MTNHEPCKLSDVDNTCKTRKKFPSEFFTQKHVPPKYQAARRSRSDKAPIYRITKSALITKRRSA